MDERLAISLKNVSKKYRLFDSVQERMKEALHPFQKRYHKEFWALKDISFDVSRGTTLGIIGRNGSGKSTLLQIICSVLRATEGDVSVNGRVTALLELGAGFNPEFTGRENVIFNGSVVGCSAEEMSERLPLIEKFADIGEFMDQPVKVYSSGMFARLAFAAAINVDPDILVVDEALSVGDAKFQYKCFLKFNEFKKSGKTIIFVSHDSNAILKHCDSVVLLDQGENMGIGAPREMVNYYVDIMEGRALKEESKVSESSCDKVESDQGSREEEDLVDIELNEFLHEIPEGDKCHARNSFNKSGYRQGFNKAEIIDYLLVGAGKIDPTILKSRDRLDLYIKGKFHEPVESPLFGFQINSVDSLQIYALNSFFNKGFISPAKEGDILVARFSVDLNLAPGEYFFDLGLDHNLNSEGYESMDRRCGLIHLSIRQNNYFHGLVDLDASFSEIIRFNS